MSAEFPRLTAEEAASLVEHGDFVAASGFTPAGAVKAIPRAIAKQAREFHGYGQPYQIRLLTGASTGASMDDALAQADAVSWRAPYQFSRPMRERINSGQIEFVDMHLSHVPQSVLFGFFGKIDVAIVEASEVTSDGKIYFTTSLGASPTFVQAADRILIELNHAQSRRIGELADIATPAPPPRRAALSLDHPLQKIGKPFVQVDPKNIIGIVETNEPDELGQFAPPDESSERIADFVVEFLHRELSEGRIPQSFLPLQSGVGNVANAVMDGIGRNTDIPDFLMYSEVLQPAPFRLLREGRLLGASTCALTLLPEHIQELGADPDFFKQHVVLRPQEISNNPAIVRQLGVIAMNTALEIDLYGHVNSTHVCGQVIMNGIGGSGDFARNAYLSIFMCPSIVKDGKISSIVPMCPHVDHNEHSVHVVVTEQGLADLRGLSPQARARRIIDCCAHPSYRDYLHRYLESTGPGHINHNLDHCFELHHNLARDGRMLPISASGKRSIGPGNVTPTASNASPRLFQANSACGGN